MHASLLLPHISAVYGDDDCTRKTFDMYFLGRFPSSHVPQAFQLSVVFMKVKECYILVKKCTWWGLPILVVLLMFLSKGKKKKHHDLSVEDNNIILTSTKEQKKKYTVVFISQTDRRWGALQTFCTWNMIHQHYKLIAYIIVYMLGMARPLLLEIIEQFLVINSTERF